MTKESKYDTIRTMKKRDVLLQLAPFFTAIVLGVVTMLVYAFAFEGSRGTIYAEIAIGMALPLALPVIGWITKKPFPVTLSALVCSHVFFAIDLGAAMGFNGRIAWWDLFLHGAFGLLCAVFLSFFLIRWKGTGTSRFGQLFFIAFATLGFAGLWEIFEYLCDLMFHNDPQGVWSAVANGENPMTDTMTDMLITLAGVALYYLALWIDQLTGYRFMRKFYRAACGEENLQSESKL